MSCVYVCVLGVCGVCDVGLFVCVGRVCVGVVYVWCICVWCVYVCGVVCV